MGLFASIDLLLKGAYYLGWALAVLCIPGSVVLLLCNFALGIAAVATCLAALAVASGVALLILPEQVKLPGVLGEKRRLLGGALLVVGAAIMGITFFANGGLPALNLIFM